MSSPVPPIHYVFAICLSPFHLPPPSLVAGSDGSGSPAALHCYVSYYLSNQFMVNKIILLFPFLPFAPPIPSPPFPSLRIPFLPFFSPSLPRSGPLIPARGYGERCKLPQRSLGRNPSWNRIWCILALKSDSMVAIILIIFLRINWPTFVQCKQ